MRVFKFFCVIAVGLLFAMAYSNLLTYLVETELLAMVIANYLYNVVGALGSFVLGIAFTRYILDDDKEDKDKKSEE